MGNGYKRGISSSLFLCIFNIIATSGLAVSIFCPCETSYYQVLEMGSCRGISTDEFTYNTYFMKLDHSQIVCTRMDT